MLINTMWIGDRLGPIQAACLRSFMRHGHDVLLHCFERPRDVPTGVKLFDAKLLMNENEIMRHKATGSVSLVSNVYRYRIMQRGMGPYVDCDVYCVRPFEFSDYMYGYESVSKINGAVLNIPKKSDLLDHLIEASEDRYFVPPWLTPKKQIRDKILRKVGFGRHVSNRPWGVLGPNLLTYYISFLGLADKAVSIDYYYPLHCDHVSMLWQKGLGISDVMTRNTFGIHLWNANLERINKPIEVNTPLFEMVNS